FSVLSNPVAKPYAGQHGYQTNIWPVPLDMILTKDEIESDRRIKSPEEEIIKSYGIQIGGVIKRMYKFERRLILAFIAYVMFSMLIITVLTLTGKPIISPVISVCIGVFSNIVFSLLVYYSTNLRSDK
ncbi:MAG: hypothetical protein PHO32_04325, partial [Candidatus Cloacimonetes bacterium]|nr:hypothetical protein [Candidatus Cloacimonadota bacterium]